MVIRSILVTSQDVLKSFKNFTQIGKSFSSNAKDAQPQKHFNFLKYCTHGVHVIFWNHLNSPIRSVYFYKNVSLDHCKFFENSAHFLVRELFHSSWSICTNPGIICILSRQVLFHDIKQQLMKGIVFKRKLD